MSNNEEYFDSFEEFEEKYNPILIVEFTVENTIFGLQTTKYYFVGDVVWVSSHTHFTASKYYAKPVTNWINAIENMKTKKVTIHL